MFCSRCGTPLGEGDRFCKCCGAVICVVSGDPNEKKPPEPKKQYTTAGALLGAFSLTFGILSLVFFCYVGASLLLAALGFSLGLVGVMVSKHKEARYGTSIGGIVCSSVVLGIWLLFLIIAIAIGSGASLNTFFGIL